MYWRRATLVIIEYGGSWPRWLSPERGDMAVVAQHYEGPPRSLLTQVASRLTALESMGWQFESVVFVCNRRFDSDATAARSVLARGLLARLHESKAGHLTLSVDEYAERRAVYGILALAAGLEAAAEPQVELAVRIGNAEPLRSFVPTQAVVAQAS